MLIPTIRASKSEIWVTFNPDLDSDATYEQFVTSPPDDLAWIRKVSWRDNAFYSEVLDGHRRKMQRELPEEYDNIYEGNPRAAAQGAIYSREVTVLVQSGRFRDVPYDPSLPVHTAWDLGWNDQTTIIFLQRVASAVMIIDYEEASFLRPDEWAKVVNSKPYDYASHWMPHDAGLRTQPAGGVSFASQMKMMLKAVPRVAKRPENTEIPIRQARMMFPRVYIDKTNCARLLECLKRFKRGVPDSTGEPGAPVKDEYRHGADAFGLLALIVDKLSNDTEMPPIHFHTHRISNPRVGY
jgi:phage terminase large subunit